MKLHRKYYQIKDPGLHQIASALLGAAVAKVAGGNAQAGASSAASGTKNNYYAFAFYKDELKDKVKEVLGNDEKAQAINDAIERELNPNDDNPPTSGSEVGAARKIQEILNENGISGDQANEIVKYYLDKADERLVKLDSDNIKGLQTSIDLAMNAGLIIVGIGELEALYQAGRISYLTYMAQRGSQGASKAATGETSQVAGQAEKIAGSNINHVNGAIGEAHGYNQALAKGEIGIQAPGKVTATGPDYITFDAENGVIKVWDAKYSSTGKYPSNVKGFGSEAWLNETKQAIDNISDPVLKQQVQTAFDSGKISWEMFKWPQ